MTTARQSLRSRRVPTDRRPLAERANDVRAAYWYMAQAGERRLPTLTNAADNAADHTVYLAKQSLPRQRRPLFAAAAAYRRLAAAYRRLEDRKYAAKVARETAWARYATSPYDAARYAAYMAACMESPTLGGGWEAARVYGQLRLRGYDRAIAAYAARNQRLSRREFVYGRTAN